MSTFRGHAKSLAELYVYYQRLKTDNFYPTLAKYVSNTAYRMWDQTSKYKKESVAVRTQARNEFAKEKALLERCFGAKLNLDYYDGSSGARKGFREVIEALNNALNLKDAYKRSMQLIKTTQGQKGVYSYYSTYFLQAWDEREDDINKMLSQEFTATGDLALALDRTMDHYLPELCELGIRKMLDGPEVENEFIDKDLKDAYKILISQIGKVGQGGSMAQQIYDTYKLASLKETLLNSLEPLDNIPSNGALKKAASQHISKDINVRSGEALEAIESATFSLIAEELSKKKGIKVETKHVGRKKAKADNIMTIGIDMAFVEEALEQVGRNRTENIEAFSALGERLKNLDDGFIIYSSDKNYTLNEGFYERGGFGAGGQGATAKDFLSNVYKNSSSLNTIIGMTQQMGKGAMLEKAKKDFEVMLAQDVAYMLFDDYVTIGEESSGASTIHVMNLNNVMIPLSVILTLLADAIEEIDDERVRNIANVRVSAPKILYPTQGAQEEAWPNDGHGAWEYQREYALNNTKIHTNFLRNFKQLVEQYL